VPVVRRLAALVGATFAVMAFAPIAIGEDAMITFSPLVEAWYQPHPSCLTPVGCVASAAVPASPFPAGTMHVGVAAGHELARTYLAFAFGQLTAASSARLTVPLDVEQTDGSTSPADAKVIVCLTTSPGITAIEGSTDPPPPVDCRTPAPARFVALPVPHLEADLGALLAGLPTATGVALLPDGATIAPTDAWRIVFSAHTRGGAGATGASTLTAAVAPAEAATPEPSEANLVDAVAPASLREIAPVSGTAFAAPPTTTSPRIDAIAEPAPSAAANAVELPSPDLVTFGYAYPGIWLLPLALLVLVPAVGRALTRDLSPRNPREPA
jgi:hypothetical protein